MPANAKQPIKRPWCSDPSPMTPERILAIAQTKGEFTVHRYLYRAEALRRACAKMVDAGELKRARTVGDFLVFVVPDVRNANGGEVPDAR